MVRKSSKIMLVILFLLIIGLNGAFIFAYSSELEKTQKQTEILPNKITPDEARTIAQNSVPGVITSFEIDNEHGVPIYEVEITDGNTEREVRIDFSGVILGIEVEEQIVREDLRDSEVRLTPEDAEGIALREIDGRVIKVEFETEDGIQIYEVEVREGNDIIEFEIDAYTGEILEVELDNDD